METFNLTDHLTPFDNTLTATGRRPVIAITTNFMDGDAALRKVYYDQVVQAGGVPVLMPPVADVQLIAETLDRVDGLLLTGGADLNPLWLGEEPQPGLGNVNSERDLPELLTATLAYRRQLPVLGICRGMQLMAAALGGILVQDIKAAETVIKHSQQAPKNQPTHSVTATEGSVIARLYGTEKFFVNSFHHQAVVDPGAHFTVTATAPDGTIEAMESNEHKDLLAVQWHPEWLEAEGGKLFAWLVERAGLFKEAKRLHTRMVTLDSHCDTPMFFPQGINFCRRDDRIKVDLHKMTDGRQDAVTMVAYLPQPKPGQPFAECVELSPRTLEKYPELAGNITPKRFTDLIFDEIEENVQRRLDVLTIARTPLEIREAKQQGKKAIVLGIENGLALEGNPDNVAYFAERGITYITLCHNGDNDICDSCWTTNTHNGVSSLGEKVIEQMNRHGVMVDLSHGGEKSFFDALEISKTPIVCSHSSCKALCGHRRNLTDEQLRAIAKAGGVAQITIYDSFLKQGGGASIVNVMEHLNHAIDVAGIDHVGLGTDFDGDGGVPGLSDSSELIRFTVKLLEQRYSEADIAKIWGGNWLRVMEQVQRFAL